MKKCPKCGREFEDANTLCPADGTVLAKTDDALIGQTLADKYRIEEIINEGGMGAVYRGTHVLMDKTVAVKVLHPALAADDKIVARFSREAKAASRISHPHALSVTDFGESGNGVVFLVMEYLKGETLKDVIHREGPMPLPRVVEIIRQVCGALEAAHNEGVVHRDLKSDNIMLVDIGGGDWAKVLDFGIAKITEKVGQDPALTAPNLIIGTPQYMSPEQCSQAADIDSRSDIYSLGVILYEMLVGHVPFTGESPTAIMMKHLQEPPPSVLEEREDLPARVGRVVARAMAKRPEDRFQTVSELAEELTAAAEEPAAASASVGPGAPDRTTNRIVVPTGSNEPPRSTASEEQDESTVIRPRPQTAAVEAEIISTEAAVPPESFNPWRIIVPAVAGLLVIFAVVFALTRNSSSQPTSNNNSAPLNIEPGSRPVQPAHSPTGAGEQNIAPPTSSTANTNVPSEPNLNRNENTKASGENKNTKGNANGEKSNENSNKQAGENDNQTEPQPSPSANKNSNQRREPPKTNINGSPASSPGEPPPMPTPKPKPSASGNFNPGTVSDNP
ncbi:MAG: eukaryotic-like serine/threonine-protein kinase [Acidobacteriota bacterium]|jgi:serine/threonine-protein kinase|nr:eukaryotic-like serine/threonine-protein kinase [Acidobacteriota bacterium]